MPQLEADLQSVLQDHTAVDPQRENVKWTYLTPREVAERLAKRGTRVCANTAQDLLARFGFVRREAQKKQSMAASPHRNEQFENIAWLKIDYFDSDDPIVSMDSKKRELLGNFYRKGPLYSTDVRTTFDHDFPSFARGAVIPHGLYDLKRNIGHITLGVGHDTSELACDSLELWWKRYGRAAYPRAKSMLLLCDGGGSNSARHDIFKEDLQCLVNRLGLPIRVAHYPPYCSKYNPIDHRFFPHVARAWQGAIFHTVDLMKRLLKRVYTRTGLKATAAVLKKFYHSGREASEAFLRASPIRFDFVLPEWNYVVVPTRY
jgi:hypothetical protein